MLKHKTSIQRKNTKRIMEYPSALSSKNDFSWVRFMRINSRRNEEDGAAHGIRTHTFYLLRVATPANWSRAALNYRELVIDNSKTREGAFVGNKTSLEGGAEPTEFFATTRNLYEPAVKPLTTPTFVVPDTVTTGTKLVDGDLDCSMT